MNMKITPEPLFGKVAAIPSKSHIHRLLIAGFLANADLDIPLENPPDDIEATKRCLKQLKEPEPILDCGESGSTLRFLLPVAMALHDKVVFMGRGRLPFRPVSPLKEEMEAHGCTFTSTGRSEGESVEIFTVTGKLGGGTYKLAGDISSQYISGLLLALPLLETESQVVLTTGLESKGYVDMSLQTLEAFGINIWPPQIIRTGTYRIRGNQRYTMNNKINPEGDWSNAAFWIIAGMLTCDSAIDCVGLNAKSRQPDRAITMLARNFGGRILEKNDSVMSMFDDLTGTDIDASEIPDLVPILAVAAAVAKGTTTIHHAGRLRLKESDRLAAITDCLTRLGARVTEKQDGLIIQGVPALKGGTVNGHNDHRIVMAMAVAAAACTKPVIIEGAEAVNKSYPNFFEDFICLGGVVDEV